MVAILKAVAAERITDGVQVIGDHPYMFVRPELKIEGGSVYVEPSGKEAEERCVYVPLGYRHKYNTETGEIALMKD